MDLVVTVPKAFWFEWIAEGDAVGAPVSGEEWGFWLGRGRPPIEPGDRLYVVAWGALRGYAPVTRLVKDDRTGRWVICREAGAVACTVSGRRFDGFQGFRKRWWEREEELPFIDWKVAGIPMAQIRKAIDRGAIMNPWGVTGMEVGDEAGGPVAEATRRTGGAAAHSDAVQQADPAGDGGPLLPDR